MSSIASFSSCYNSVDELVLGIRSLGADITVCQLDRGIRPSALEGVVSGQSKVMRFDVGNRLHHLLATAPGFRTFGLLAYEQAPTRVGRTLFKDDSLLQVDPDLGLEATIEAGFCGFTFAVADERLRELAALQSVDEDAVAGLEGGVTRPVPPGFLRHLRQRVEATVALSHVAPDDEDVAAFFDEELPALLVRGWCTDPLAAVETPRLASRSRAFRRATEVIRCEGGEIRTIEQLCKLSASSYSTLERAFREQTGLTPKRYLAQSRLSGVRQSLLRDKEQSITELAHTWGFSHMSKFAADYRRLFGELPSQTTRSARLFLPDSRPAPGTRHGTPDFFRLSKNTAGQQAMGRVGLPFTSPGS